jgi:amino acid adenylation domain-containing protein
MPTVQGVGVETHQAFFARMLAGVDEPTLPFGLAADAPVGSGSAVHARHDDPALGSRVRAAAQAAGVSVSALAHLAFALWLGRVSRRVDVVFGTVVSGASPGPRALPLRIAFGDLGAMAALRRTDDTLATLTLHADAPPASLPPSAAQFAAVLDCRGDAADDAAVAAAIVVRVDAREDGFELHARAPAAVDPQRVCALMCAALEALVTTLAQAPDAAAPTLDVLPAAERALLLEGWNATVDFPVSACIHELFEAQAARTPRAIALVLDGRTLSYAELNARTNRLAHHLRRLGVRPDRPVGIAAERSLEMVVGLLAILKAGGAYVPLDPAYPAERLAYMLQDSAPAVVLVQGRGAALDTGALPVLDLDADAAAWATESAADPARAAVGLEPHHLAYIIYTSGSTGAPKGVMVEHANVVRLMSATQPWYGFDASDVWTLFHSYAFDFSVWELWGALAYGGRLVVVPHAVARSPQEFYRLLCAEGVTVLNQTPSAFRQLVAAQAEEPGAHRLRYVIFGGEALEVPTLRPWYERERNAGTQLVNMYGITETTVHVTLRLIAPADVSRFGASPIGRRIPDLSLYILDEQLRPAPIGVEGELYVGGAGVARGYLNRPELNALRFIADPFGADAKARLYRTGDTGRFLADGSIEYLGRNDDQVKIRGFRIELGEIEARLAEHPGVGNAAVVAREDEPGNKRLVAYVTPASAGQAPDLEALRRHLGATLPEHMVPAAFVQLERLPLTNNGKLDRKALPRPAQDRPELSTPFQFAVGDAETRLCAVFAKVLGMACVGRQDNFFELGGDSLQVLEVLATLERGGARGLSATAFFRQPTAEALAKALTIGPAPEPAAAAAPIEPPAPAAAAAAAADRVADDRPADEPIAIVAVAGRFPGARDVEEFWANLCAGRDGITHFAEGELDPALAQSLVRDPDYVRARGLVDGVELFDPAFFGLSPREAELMDPQQRLFMELSWECLERGGHAPDAGEMPIGVFGGMYNATYHRYHITPRPDLVDKLGEFAVMLGNEKDFIATRTAFRLNLTGPAISVHTACSTSLVAIAQAFWSLRNGDCRMALAGGAAVTCPPRSGYLYQAGAMLSPDGRTRTFDAQAEGTVFSDGAAMVLLKRLSDALADGNEVIALIRGVGMNNDGRDKASFTAPSIEGQATVIARAQQVAGVDARSISYIEAHGTATPIGDPVEVEALTQAFRRSTGDTGFCRIGSVKSNVGHTLMAAGAAGVIKTALALAHEQLPPTINYTRANPAIDFAASPFVVNARLHAWPRGAAPRRAGVSSFGVGGTNAHAVLEEAPLRAPSAPAQGPQRLQLCARTPAALEAMAARLATHLENDPSLNLADVAFTLQAGRTPFAHRCAVVAQSAADAVAALRTPGHAARRSGVVAARQPALLWLFPGQGAQYAGMGRALAEFDPAFGAAFAQALAAVQPWLAFDLAQRLADASPDALRATEATQPALFCIEVALARAWQSRGLVPVALIGHSVGEFAAAVIAGVMSLADAARLVARRGALLQALPAGAMLSVRLPLAELQARMPADVFLAAENGPQACVVAGETAAIDAWTSTLDAQGVAARKLVTSHAFHSPMMDAAAAPFEALVREVTLSAPRIPIVSTATGEWLTDAQATDPAYWARQLREPVRFSRALRTALQRHAEALAIEMGPRDSLSTLVRQHGAGAPVTVASLADAPALEAERLALADAQLWTLGIATTTAAASPSDRRRRVRLPTYPFERKRCWIDASPALTAAASSTPTPAPAAAVAAIDATPAAIAPPVSLPSTSSTAMATSTPSSSRRPALIARLRDLFGDVAGLDLAEVDPTAGFVEFGIDSLILTQVAMQTKKRFGVAVTFRQLSESCRSFEALAAFLDEAMPADAAPAAAPAVPVAQAAAPAALASAAAPAAMAALVPLVPLQGAAGGSFVQQVIQQQMALMAQQLAVLGGAAQAQAPVAEVAPAVAVPAPVAAAPAAAEPAATEVMRYDVKKAFGAIARIHTQASAITARQQARLEAFARRYIERTARSKAFTSAHRPHLADPRVVNGFRPLTKEITYQLVIERSKGAHMWDIDGNEYVDVLNGFGMCLFGWQPDFVQEAVRAQLELGYEIGPQHPLAGEVADLVCEMTGADRAGLCNTGSEAVMAAVRIARTVTCRNTIVVFTGSYHGTFDEVLVRAGRNAKGIPAAPGIMADVFDDIRVLDYGTPESLEFIRRNADDLAAVLIEPVQSRRPDFQPREFLKQVREITEASGTCMIMDEVVTGFRVHPGGVQAIFDIRPDLSAYGKVIGGGFPIGVVAGKREYMDALDGGAWHYGDDSVPTVGVTYFAGTFVRHPLAMAAAKASLLHLKQQGGQLQEQLNLVTAAMADELCAFCREVGAPIEIRHFGSLWRVTWLEDHPLQDLLFAMMRSRGVHILDNFPCFMTTAHTPQDIATIKSAFKESVAELQQAEFLPARKQVAAEAVDASKPPVPGARLGRGPKGEVQWYVPHPDQPGKFVVVTPE